MRTDLSHSMMAEQAAAPQLIACDARFPSLQRLRLPRTRRQARVAAEAATVEIVEMIEEQKEKTLMAMAKTATVDVVDGNITKI